MRDTIHLRDANFMGQWKPLSQRWRELTIPKKLSLAFSAMLALIVLVAVTGYVALTIVRRQTEAAIVTSMEIQRLVLEMEAGLQHARLLEKEFFLRWPLVGFAAARQTYAEAHREQVNRVVLTSVRLQQLISGADVSLALAQGSAELSTYVPLVTLYANSFNEAVELVAELSEEKTGVLSQLAQSSILLRVALQAANDPAMMAQYHEMQTFEREYLLTRQRPKIQSALNVASRIHDAIDRAPEFDAGQRGDALVQLDAYQSVAKGLIQIDNKIRTLRNGFDLQATAVDPISDELISAAKAEAERARDQIARTSRFATTLIIIAVLAALALVGIIASVLNNSITRNVVKLTDAAAQLQSGDLAARAHIDSFDELGQLAASFNAMAARINDLVGDLEGRAAIAQDRLFQAIESISEGFALYDADDRFVLANRKYREMLANISHLASPGVHFEQVVRTGAERGLFPEADGRIDDWVRARVAKHERPQGAFEQRLKDGRWLQISEQKTQRGEIVGIYTDITDRKHAEEALRRQKEYFESLVLNSPVAIVTTDLDSNVVSWNPAAENLFGYSRDEVVSRNLDDLVAQGGATYAEAVDITRTTLNGNLVQLITRRNRKDGSLVDVELLTVPVTVAEENVGFIVIYHNITELQRARQKAEAANESKSAFLANVSHELRTPMTSVLGFAKLIKKRLDELVFPAIRTDDPKTERAMRQVEGNIDIIVSEGERLTALINDVLDLAKLEAGKIAWNMQPLSVPEVIEHALMATSSLFTQKAVALVEEVATGLPQVIGDHDRLIQVLINLISNAVKFTEEGSITCRARQNNGEIEISIKDTGTGIAQADQPQIFEKFKQVGDTLTDKPTGTGLGLPICKQIVEHHGGRIWVESDPGKGSTFFFTLPVTGAGTGEPAEAWIETMNIDTLVKQLQARGVIPNPSSSAEAKKTVLVVDDDPNIRELLKQELEAKGYLVIEAQDGLEALNQLKFGRPHLITLDVMMPDLNGFDIAAVLKNNPQTADIPIIILSIVQDKARGYRLGVDRYLTKPIDTDELLEEVELLLAQGTSKKKILVVDEETSTISTLVNVLQAQGYQVTEATNGDEFLEKARIVKPDMIIVNALLSERHQEIVKSLRFEKGLENVLLFFYQQSTPAI